MKHLSPLLALLAIAAALIAGCGDDDEEEPQTLTGAATGATGQAESGGTKSSYLTAADRICEEAEDNETQELRAQYPDAGPDDLSESDREQVVNEILLPSLRDQLQALRALPRPEGDEETLTELYDQLEAGIAQIEGDPQIVFEDEATELEEASSLARDYGLTECGA